jgi:predicted nucleotidyltransferase
MLNEDEQKTINYIKEFLISKNIRINKFFMFVSRSRGDYNEDSDYDFMIVTENELQSNEKRKIIGDLYRSLIIKNAIINLDLIIKSLSKYNYEKLYLGFLAYTVAREGIEV